MSMITLEELRRKRSDILTIAARHGASNVRVFGSVIRGEAGPDSDVDFLVEFRAGRGPWYGMGLNIELEDLLGCRVDVVADDELHWLVRDQVLREAVTL
jgi:predicted nucleotidyltransferase